MINLLAGLNIEIHLAFTFWRILLPFISKISTNFVNFTCFWVNVQSNSTWFVTNVQSKSPKANLIKFALLSLFNGPYNGTSKN